MTDRFLVCPIVWNFADGKSVAVFLDAARADAVISALPEGPPEGWRVFPMNELELLGWLREQRADGVANLLLNPCPNPDNRTMAGYCVRLPDLLDNGKTLTFFRELADRQESGEFPTWRTTRRSNC